VRTSLYFHESGASYKKGWGPMVAMIVNNILQADTVGKSKISRSKGLDMTLRGCK